MYVTSKQEITNRKLMEPSCFSQILLDLLKKKKIEAVSSKAILICKLQKAMLLYVLFIALLFIIFMLSNHHS